MGSYYYVKDKNSDFGYTPIPEEKYIGAIFRIAEKKGLKITDKMIFEEVTQDHLTRGKKNPTMSVLKSPALAC